MQKLEKEGGTKARLEQLIRLYESGYASELTERTLSKLFSTQAAEARDMLAVLRTDLDEYESKYGIPSNTFLEQYDRGEMGDAMDFVEWASLTQMYQRESDRLSLLTEVK